MDDGSSDATAVQMLKYQSTTPLSIQYVRQQNGGPAKARNLGISMLTSHICLMLGDDIFSSPTLLQQHMLAHQEHEDIRVAALGLTRWESVGQKITPFMKWLDEANIQFAYPKLLSGEKPNWCHFYTSNLSVKTELVRMFLFSEKFPYAAMEDAELGYRIKKQLGLELRFLPKAVAGHLHPTTFRQACKRMIRVGYSCQIFYDRWPEERPPRASGRRWKLVLAAAASPLLLKSLTTVADLITKVWCPNALMIYVLDCYREVGEQSLSVEKRTGGQLIQAQSRPETS